MGSDAIIVPSPGPCNRRVRRADHRLKASRSPPHRRRPRRARVRRDTSQAFAADAGPKDKLRILILGGTGFTEPHEVRNAFERGHHVTLFNRGRRPQPWLIVLRTSGAVRRKICKPKG